MKFQPILKNNVIELKKKLSTLSTKISVTGVADISGSETMPIVGVWKDRISLLCFPLLWLKWHV